MLVLSRDVNEVILIGDDIEVRVVRVNGTKVRIGITAPPGIPVDRQEIRVAKNLDKQRAASLRDANPSGVSS
jgi:carbon storage regulator